MAGFRLAHHCRCRHCYRCCYRHCSRYCPRVHCPRPRPRPPPLFRISLQVLCESVTMSHSAASSTPVHAPPSTLPPRGWTEICSRSHTPWPPGGATDLCMKGTCRGHRFYTENCMEAGAWLPAAVLLLVLWYSVRVHGNCLQSAGNKRKLQPCRPCTRGSL